MGSCGFAGWVASDTWCGDGFVRRWGGWGKDWGRGEGVLMGRWVWGLVGGMYTMRGDGVVNEVKNEVKIGLVL